MTPKRPQPCDGGTASAPGVIEWEAADLAPEFPVVPDLESRWYDRSVEHSVFVHLHPATLWKTVHGLVPVPSNPFAGEGGMNGLPADIIIDENVVRAAHDGRHGSDWSTVRP